MVSDVLRRGWGTEIDMEASTVETRLSVVICPERPGRVNPRPDTLMVRGPCACRWSQGKSHRQVQQGEGHMHSLVCLALKPPFYCISLSIQRSLHFTTQPLMCPSTQNCKMKAFCGLQKHMTLLSLKQQFQVLSCCGRLRYCPTYPGKKQCQLKQGPVLHR